jgi:hypothetical protein
MDFSNVKLGTTVVQGLIFTYKRLQVTYTLIMGKATPYDILIRL